MTYTSLIFVKQLSFLYKAIPKLYIKKKEREKNKPEFKGTQINK